MPELPINQIIQGDCREILKEFPEESIDSVVTSPPYGVGKEYNEHDDFFRGLSNLLEETLEEIYRITVNDGRIAFDLPHAINTDTDEVKTIIPSFINSAKKVGFNLREWIIWVKNLKNPSTSTAWGSWCSPSNPHLCNGQACESIFVFNKNSWKKQGDGSNLKKEEFIDWTNNLWLIKNEFDKDKHPAPFPQELPERLIKLYSFEGDLILDPFVGSGTTCKVAKKLDRDYIGIDLDEEYCEIARNELEQETLEAYC